MASSQRFEPSESSGIKGSLAVKLRYSKRAKGPSVRVTNDGEIELLLRAPLTAPLRAAVIEELRPWIERKLLEHRRLRQQLHPPVGTVPLLDEFVAVSLHSGRTRFGRGQLQLPQVDPQRALIRWYRSEARSRVADKLPAMEAAVGVASSRVVIADQRTRWGSCSSSGTLSFNWRLMLAPLEVFEYVLWHEICHLKVPNHSADFWQLLSDFCPQYQRKAAWLKRYGWGLTVADLPLVGSA